MAPHVTICLKLRARLVGVDIKAQPATICVHTTLIFGLKGLEDELKFQKNALAEHENVTLLVICRAAL